MFFFNSTIGRVFASKTPEIEMEDVDGDAEPGSNNTPGSDSAVEDFELINKSTESLAKAKTSGAQQGKANKRKGKKK